MSKTSLEDLSIELLLLIFDYLTSIEIFISFFHLNKYFRLIISNYLQKDHRLTQINLIHTNFCTYKLFLKEILSDIKSILTSIELGSFYYYGQIESFHQYQFQHLDSLTLRLINPNDSREILQKFLNYNRLQWFDRIRIIIDENIIGWNEQSIFCVQNIPIRNLTITGNVPYTYAQHLMTSCYSITHLTIHLKFDHDLPPLLYYLPNLIECDFSVDDRGRDLTNALPHLIPLSSLKTFKYQGLLPSIYLHRLILQINSQIEHLYLHTQDYQWPFHVSEGFSSNFFHLLTHLKTFNFYFRLIPMEQFPSDLSELKFLIKKTFCHNLAFSFSKDIGQIFSLPYAFKSMEIYQRDFFQTIQFLENKNEFNWNSVEHLTLHMNIYDFSLLQSIQDQYPRLRSINYQVPHFSLIPQENELHEYDIQLNRIKKLVIRDSVKHGCHVPQPLCLLTLNLRELDIDHFYLMQIISIGSQQIQTRICQVLNRLYRLTVRQFDERLTEYFFSYFSQIKILSLIFTTYKMQVYRTKLIFLDQLFQSMPNLVSLKLEHLKRPHEYYAYLELQTNVEEQILKFHLKNSYWSKWYDDHTQKHHRHVTLLFSK